MRKLFTILFLLIAFAAQSQLYQSNTTTYGVQWNRLRVPIAFEPPHDTTSNKVENSIASINGVFYIKKSSAWAPIESTANLGLQEVSDINKVTTNRIEVNGIVSRDTTLSIGNVIIAAPRWTSSDSINLWTKGIGVNQGNAWDGHYRYVDSNSAIYKLDANYNKILANNNVFAGISGTHNHIGDIDYNPNDGHLYVPMENLVSSVYTNMGIAVFDTGTLALIRFMPTSTIHNVEKTALTIYDTSLATMDFFVSQKIYIHAPYDATLLDSVQLSQAIPGTQGFVFDPNSRLWYFISEQKLWSANEDGTGVLELTTLPNTQINEGHVGEGLAIVNGKLEGLIASRADALSKLYTFIPSPVNPFYVQRGSIDQNGNSTLKKMTSESNVINSLTAIKSTMRSPASIVSGYLSHDAVSTVFSRNAYFNGTRWMRDSAGVPSFYFGYHQNKQAAYLLSSNPGTSLKVSLDTIFKATPGGTIIFKASVGSVGPGDIVAPVKIEPAQINNTPGYANVERTALSIKHGETASMIRMQNIGAGGGTVYFHVPNDANASLGNKLLINFADNTTTPLFILDNATQSLRIRNHIGVGTALNANPSGLGTVSLSVSDKTVGGRAQLDLIGNRNFADQTAGQYAFWNNTTRFAAVSALRGSTDTTGYITFSTKDTGTNVLTERVRISQKGLLGIGTTPTALVDIAANAATASQIRFRDGITPTTLTKGYMWFDGTALNFYNGSTTTNLLTVGGGTTLNGTGFVKATGTTISYDNSTYTLSNSAITGATKTKITYDAKGLVTAGADATTADIAASTNKNYVTDAQQTVIGNTSGTNTGDQDLSGLAVKANNLSDLTNTGTARTNLGLGTLATQNGTFSGTSSGTNTGDETTSRINALYGYTPANGANYFPIAGGSLTGTTNTGYVGFPAQTTAMTPPTEGFKLYDSSGFTLLRSDGFRRVLSFSGLTANVKYNFPVGTTNDTVTTNIAPQTLTNKTISGTTNAITGIAESSITNLTTDLVAKVTKAGEAGGQTINGGTLTTQNLTLQPNAANSTTGSIISNGKIIFGTDNTYDIGASGATRPKNLYLSGKITLANGTAGAPAIDNGNLTGIYFPGGSFMGVSIAGTSVWYWNNASHFQPTTHNVYDIGVAATRVRTGYFGTSIGIGGTSAIDASATLDIVSTTKGVLLPRMTTTQRDAISSPAEGLEIYNLTTHTKNFYNGTVWKAVITD